MFYLILFVLISAAFFIVINQILIRKYYWGPSGKPPLRYDSHQETPPDERKGNSDDSPLSS